MILIMYSLICFTDFLPDAELRFDIGYVSIIILSIHLLLNLTLMAVTGVRRVILKVKQIKHRLKLKAIHAKV